jgi:hypothetical protein
VAPLKTAILSMPQGSGKTRICEQLAARLGCATVIDEWHPRWPMREGALHLTNVPAEEVLL